MQRCARVTVAYDGTGFHGFAEHDGVRTVMGELRAAIERVVRVPVAVSYTHLTLTTILRV